MEELQTIHGLALFVAAVAGLAIAHRAVLRLPIGLPRLVFILPILPIFFVLPWTIPIYHLRAILSFIFLWTVPSKLLLLCWDAGIDYPSSGFLYFATVVMLPIRVRGKMSKKEGQDNTQKGRFWWQFIAVIIILNIYSYRKGLPLWAIYVLYTCHMYLGLELMLGGLAKLATACFGVESDPQFNNPFMSASLSEFWGRRWNLVVTTILRSTVYNPALALLMRAEKQKSFVPRPLSSSISNSSVQNASLCSKGQANQVTSLDDVNAKTMEMSHTTESDGSNPKFAKQESAAAGSQCGTQAESASNMFDIHASKASKKDGHMNHHGLDFNTQLKHVLNSNPRHNDLSPIIYSEGSMPEAENGIKSTQMSSTGLATETIHDDDNPVYNMNSKDRTLNLDAECNPKPNSNFSASDPNPKPRSPVGLKSSQQAIDDPDIHTPQANPTPTYYPIPEIYIQEAKNGASLRTRAAAMLRAKAAAMLSNPIHPNDQTLYPPTGDEKKEAIDAGERPSLRARAVAMLVTFAVSGLVHELIFYYINKSRATGEVTAFFILHGFATALEVLLKKTMLAQVHLPRPLSIALTLAFLYITAAWLFMPALTRYNADINTIAEYQRLQSALVSFVASKRIVR